MENSVPVQTQTYQSSETWKRGLFMLLFALAFAAGQMVLNVIAIVQFIWLLAQHEHNERLAKFGKSLGLWLSETAAFLSCATEDKPFPWRDWP
jgi:hypothetical protein